MRYLMLLSGTNPATPPPPELFEAIMKLGGEATQAGVLLDTAGLLPSAAGARVALEGGEVTVTDGPFAESKELISYALYEVRSKEEAVEWASRFIKLHRDHWAGWNGSTHVLPGMGAPGPMTEPGHEATRAAIEAVWRIESPRLIAGLARITGDVGTAEELAQDALVIALDRWPVQGVPDGPGAWLMATAKHRAIDLIRRRASYERKLQEIGRDAAL